MNPILKNRYKIERQLSHKSGRTTFIALDTINNRPVVIKILRFDDDFGWDDLKLFEREASTLQNLTHSAIPEYIDYFEVETEDIHGFALVQSYIPAESLQTIITQGRRFSESELIEFAQKMLDILLYLHQQNPPVIHRDIKPSNILMANRSSHSIGDVYLVDFGSVQTAAQKIEGTITIVGSYGYMPLEQFGGQTTPASDLYSLGMTIIYALTGSHPNNLSSVRGQIQFNDEHLSHGFSRWLKKMTYPHLDKRYESVKLAKTALEAKSAILETDTEFCEQIIPLTHSRAEIKQDMDTMEICYPDHDRVNFGIGFWVSAFIVSGILGIDFFFVVLIYGFPAVKLVEHFFPSLLIKKFERILSIDLDGVIKSGVRNKSGQIIWDENSSFTDNIRSLKFIPAFVLQEYHDSTGAIVKSNPIKVNPRVSLYAGKFDEYHLTSRVLSQSELWELGEKISNFIGIKLDVINGGSASNPKRSSN